MSTGSPLAAYPVPIKIGEISGLTPANLPKILDLKMNDLHAGLIPSQHRGGFESLRPLSSEKRIDCHTRGVFLFLGSYKSAHH